MTKLLCSTLLLLVAGPLAALPDLWIGAGVGSSPTAGTQGASFPSVTETDGPSWRLSAGADLGRYFGLELAYRDLARQLCCEGFADLGFDLSVRGLSAALSSRLPLNRFSLFAKIGVFTWEEEGNLLTIAGPRDFAADGTDLLIGAGIDYELWRDLGVRADWERLEFNDLSSDLFWISVQWRFE